MRCYINTLKRTKTIYSKLPVFTKKRKMLLNYIIETSLTVKTV